MSFKSIEALFDDLETLLNQFSDEEFSTLLAFAQESAKLTIDAP